MLTEMKCPRCGTLQSGCTCWRCRKRGEDSPTVPASLADMTARHVEPKAVYTRYNCIFCGVYVAVWPKCAYCEVDE